MATKVSEDINLNLKDTAKINQKFYFAKYFLLKSLRFRLTLTLVNKIIGLFYRF